MVRLRTPGVAESPELPIECRTTSELTRQPAEERHVPIRCTSRGMATVAASVWLVGVASIDVANAQKPRLRTLKYDQQSEQWSEVVPPPPGTPKGDLFAIRVLLEKERFRSVLSSAKRFVKNYGEDDANFPAVMICRGQAWIGKRKYGKALAVVEEFLDRFGGIELTDEAQRQRFVIAEAYLGGFKRKFMGLRILSGIDRGYAILDEISFDSPDPEIAVLAIKTKADHLFLTGDHGLAELEYGRLLTDHPNSRYHRFALRRSADAALASFAGVEYDDAPLIEARGRFVDYRVRYPAAAAAEQVDSVLNTIRARRAEKHYVIAEYYERTEHLSSAVYYYRIVMERWPETVAASKARTRLELLGALNATPDRPDGSNSTSPSTTEADG